MTTIVVESLCKQILLHSNIKTSQSKKDNTQHKSESGNKIYLLYFKTRLIHFNRDILIKANLNFFRNDAHLRILKNKEPVV